MSLSSVNLASESLVDLSAHERRVTRVCFDAEPSTADLDALGSAERWLSYRRMVRARFEKVLRAAYPRTVDALGTNFDAAFSRWLDDAPPSGRIFWKLPFEFSAHAAADIAGAADWAEELCRFEGTLWRVLNSDRTAPPPAELAFDLPPLMNPTLELLDVSHPVHRKDKDLATRGKWHLCVYRNSDNKAVTVVLNSLARDLVDAFSSSRESMTEIVQQVAQRRSDGIGPKFLDSLGGMLADHLERGLLLGSRP